MSRDQSTREGDRLLRRAARYGGGWTVLLAGLAVVGIAAELLLPAALGRALDAALAGDGVAWWLTAAVGLVAVTATAEILSDLAVGRSVARATARLRHRLIGHILRLHPRAARDFPAGDLISRLVGQVPAAGQAGVAVVALATTGLPAVGSLIALTLIDRWLGLTFVVALLLLALLLRTFVADASDAAAGYQRVQGRLAGRLAEALTGARTVGAAGTTDREAQRVLAPLPELRRYGDLTWAVLARGAARGATVAPLLQLSVVAVGGVGLAAGRLTPGQLFAAWQYAAIGAGLGAVVEALNGLARARAGSRRTAQVLAAPEWRHGGADLPARADLPAGPGRLELSGVTVVGDPEPLLADVDLVVPPGTAVAVVGASGAGKSVLAEVAGRLRDPDLGQVLLDGVPLAALRRSALRRAVGYARERPVLVGATLADVIGLGHPTPDLDLDRVRAAARTACVDDFVNRLPDRYRTRLADAPMSGGEAQRLGLARALHADRLLILDDATASLDTVTERQISRALTEAAPGLTRLVVAHRVGTAARCDQVVWLDRGRIRATGPHHVLWRDPAYRALFDPGAPFDPESP